MTTEPTPPECSTGVVEAGVCQPIGGMTPDDLAPLDGTEPEAPVLVAVGLAPAVRVDNAEAVVEVAPAPPAGATLPATGAPFVFVLLVLGSMLVGVGRGLLGWSARSA